METLPNPREEPAFRKGGGLFLFTRILRLMHKGLPSFCSSKSGWSIWCDLRWVSSPAAAVASRDGEHCLRSVLTRSWTERVASQAARGLCVSPIAEAPGTCRSPPALYKNFEICTITKIFPPVLIPRSSCTRFSLRTTSPAVHLAERRYAWLFCRPFVHPACSEPRPVRTARTRHSSQTGVS
jgi:hypothetical protein